MDNPIIPPIQAAELPPQIQAHLTTQGLPGQDYFVAQFDTSVDFVAGDFSAMKRLQDPAKFKKARFNTRLYQK
ncbi:hypothetical protein [Vampirovibrio chlorellavorus]|uniref:hypothetical protein n=1 Tax=Vampirovibrio chlorellavorus TaxID=758823 RepID=UPI0026EBF66B|nr:hypothetical protein [Vampirovibrio chlorellavorus]